ncbi:MAG TPA: efflux RND transporter permease subunit [Stellaceae bacterium]|nr:efflux RND transporter permease subunit [Stellaceae bacterium]
MSISEPFIRRPIATALLMAALLGFGAICYNLLPVSALPNVEFPTISVSAQLPGASPQTMADTVATPLEEEFTAIPGLSFMSSTSGLGTTSITLQFDLSTNISADAQFVQTAINEAGGLLPKNLPTPPTYRESNPAKSPVLIYAVHSDAMPLYQLDQYANVMLAEQLSTVTGVGQVIIAGQQQPAVAIQVNPQALAARGLSLPQVATAASSATVDAAKGNLQGTQAQYPLETNDQLFNAAQFKNVIVAYQNGAPVRLKDIANVINTSVNPLTGSWYGTTPSELLLIETTPGANTLQVVNSIQAMMPRLLESIPRAVHVDLVSDRSQNIRASVSDVEFTLVLTIGLVVLVIFLFLRKLWATVIPSITLPLVIIATFAGMYFLNYSVDNLSLMALTIAVGFLVDDAIVMIENIVRYIEAGDPSFDAAMKGAGQIGFTIVSMTLSLIAVFIPLLFMSGVVGLLFHEFAMTVVLTLLFSALVSLTLTPMMCAQFLTREDPERKGNLGWFERGWARLHSGYDRSLKWAFRNRFLMLLLTLGMMALTAILYVWIPKGFLPEQDTGFIFCSVQARQDTAFPAMANIENDVARIIMRNPAVADVVGFAGATGANASENTARVFIQLKPFADRPPVQQVMAQLRPEFNSVVGAKVFMQAGQDINIGGRLEQAQYQYTLTDSNSSELDHWSPILEAGMQKLNILTDVASDLEVAAPNVSIQVDRNAASQLGVSMSDIDTTLDDAFGQAQVATIYSPTYQSKVILQVAPQYQTGPAALADLYVQSSSGAQVPLSAVAHFTTVAEPVTVNHQGLFPAVTLSFNLTPSAALSQAVTAINQLRTRLGMPATVHGAFEGTAQAFQQSMSTVPLLILAAVAAIYVIMGVLYESFIHPITILSSLPPAGVGALAILMLFGYELTLIAIIGIILLMGIVKKNAIMMIDFAIEAERMEGKSAVEAIHEACLLRFRPIMMTTVCALVAGLPLALESGAGSELRRPLGVAIVGGLLVSQWLTLYTTPVIYIYLDEFGGRLKRGGAWLGYLNPFRSRQSRPS